MNNNTNLTQSNTNIESIQEIDFANPNASIIESEQVQSNSPESTGSESSVDQVSISNLIISRPEKARRCSNRLVPKLSQNNDKKYFHLQESFNADKLHYIIEHYDELKNQLQIDGNEMDPLILAKKKLAKSRHGSIDVVYTHSLAEQQHG